MMMMMFRDALVSQWPIMAQSVIGA